MQKKNNTDINGVNKIHEHTNTQTHTHQTLKDNQDNHLFEPSIFSKILKTQCSPTPHLLPSFSLSLLTQKSKFSKHRKTAWRYYYFTLLYHKSWSYEGWFLRYRARQTEFFVISGYFLPFYPPNNPENQTFEKMKKTPGGIMILNVSIINENHMMYDSWDMKCTRHIFVILGYFLSFYPYNSPKKEKFKKNEKAWRYHHFTQV